MALDEQFQFTDANKQTTERDTFGSSFGESGESRTHDSAGASQSSFASTSDVHGLWQLTYTAHRSIKRAYGWTTRATTLDAFCLDCIEDHEERLWKDGSCFVPGKIVGELRNKKSVAELHALVFDLDRSTWPEVEAALARIEAAGLFYIAYSTFNHQRPQSEVDYDKYQEFCRAGELDPWTSQGAQQFLLEVTKYPESVVRHASIVDRARDTDGGVVTVLGHEPMFKLRLVFMLDRPYRVTEVLERGFSQEDSRGRVWQATQATFAREFGLDYDEACKDVSRAYYAASCKVGMAATALLRRFEGKAVRLDAIVPQHPEALDAIIPPDQKTSKSSRPNSGPRSTRQTAGEPHDLCFNGFKLKVWAAQYAATFTVEELFNARGLVLAQRDGGGCFVKCYQEEAHGSPNPPRTYVKNGEAGKGFTMHCSGSTGGCCDLDRLHRLKGYLEAGLVNVAELLKAEFGGGPVSPRVYHESQRSRSRLDLKVVDKDGRGIDIAIFHASVVAQPGLFDFALLNELCGTQISPEVTAEQLLEFVEAGRVTIDQLVRCTSRGQTTSSDGPYESKLTALAKERAAGRILGHAFDKALAALAAEFGGKIKTIEADLKKFEREAEQPIPGLLSPEETAMIPVLRDYVRDFAVVNTGGKGVIMSLRQPDLSKAIMPRDDFEFLHRNEWIETITEHGKVTTIHPAKQFLLKPPRGTHVYHGGLVFRPSGTVGAHEYNLYRGMLVEPDPSGSCELFKELIRQVWVQHDEAAYQWVLEWFMHVIAYPGAKVSTSIAIRGDYGDGKSIVTEQLMTQILGDMQLRVANQKLILGDFNEAAIGKLLIVLEEAAFAGDKAAFDRLKEHVTGDKVVINPKFKAPIVVENHARMMIISNHAHFLHIKPGDRRYTVLESSPAWKGTNRFEQLVKQWAHGGAARFVHEALNHSFRRFDDGQKLVINTNLKTKSAVRQMAHSRSALEKCIVSFLLRGDFRSWKAGEVLVLSAGLQEGGLWPLDSELSIQSRDLEAAVVHWLRDFDARAGQYEATLHTIIETLEKFVGKTEDKRPKGRLDVKTGKRAQLPTVRVLPKRRDALDHALKQGLITEEEYSAAGPTE